MATTIHHVVRSTRSTLNAPGLKTSAPDRVDSSSRIIVSAGTSAERSDALPAKGWEGMQAMQHHASGCTLIICTRQRSMLPQPCAASPPPARESGSHHVAQLS